MPTQTTPRAISVEHRRLTAIRIMRHAKRMQAAARVMSRLVKLENWTDAQSLEFTRAETEFRNAHEDLSFNTTLRTR